MPQWPQAIRTKLNQTTYLILSRLHIEVNTCNEIQISIQNITSLSHCYGLYSQQYASMQMCTPHISSVSLLSCQDWNSLRQSLISDGWHSIDQYWNCQRMEIVLVKLKTTRHCVIYIPCTAIWMTIWLFTTYPLFCPSLHVLDISHQLACTLLSTKTAVITTQMVPKVTTRAK